MHSCGMPHLLYDQSEGGLDQRSQSVILDCPQHGKTLFITGHFCPAEAQHCSHMSFHVRVWPTAKPHELAWPTYLGFSPQSCLVNRLDRCVFIPVNELSPSDWSISRTGIISLTWLCSWIGHSLDWYGFWTILTLSLYVHSPLDRCVGTVYFSNQVTKLNQFALTDLLWVLLAIGSGHMMLLWGTYVMLQFLLTLEAMSNEGMRERETGNERLGFYIKKGNQKKDFIPEHGKQITGDTLVHQVILLESILAVRRTLRQCG